MDERKRLKVGIEQFYAAADHLSSTIAELRKREMDCYMGEQQRCVQEHDALRMRLALLNRRRERELEGCLEGCRHTIPSSLIGKNLLTTDIRKKEEIEKFAMFVNCHLQCLDNGIKTVEEVEREVSATLSDLSAHSH